MWRILSNVFATQNARLTGLYEDMHPGDFPAFFRGKLLLSQGSPAAFSCKRGFQCGFQLSDAVLFLFIEAKAVDCCVFLHEGAGFTSVGGEGSTLV